MSKLADKKVPGQLELKVVLKADVQGSVPKPSSVVALLNLSAPTR